jgi:hypothetical protein
MEQISSEIYQQKICPLVSYCQEKIPDAFSVFFITASAIFIFLSKPQPGEYS